MLGSELPVVSLLALVLPRSIAGEPPSGRDVEEWRERFGGIGWGAMKWSLGGAVLAKLGLRPWRCGGSATGRGRPGDALEAPRLRWPPGRPG